MNEIQTSDVLIIGGGIAGASAAAFVSEEKSVTLLEREAQAGYHTTGRSAAIYAPSYGPGPIRALTLASGAFFNAPPAGFSDVALLAPRGILMIATDTQGLALDALFAEVGGLSSVRLLEGGQVVAMNPLLRPDYPARGLYDSNGQDIDVNALHTGFLRQMRANGGTLITNAGVTAIHREKGLWHVETPAGRFAAPVLINAAGAWADELATMAGLAPVGLVPKRRTVAIIPVPQQPETGHLPITVDIDEAFYLKPDAGRLLISPADETPSEPCDAQPEELDVAIAVDRIETAFDLSVRRIENKWAGLRSFVADKSPVIGCRPGEDGFFWLAGQGGYGIQTSPAIGRLVAALIAERPVPDELTAHGVRLEDLRPDRF